MILAILAGLVVGSFPSADLLARSRRIDLRRSGSGNPGTANALRVGGTGLALAVLGVDLAKGAGAALIGHSIGGDRVAVAASLAAVAGQVLNPWFRFRGGKGLGVAAGTGLVIWPHGLLITLVATGTVARLGGSAAGALAGLGTLSAAAILWVVDDLPTGWGVAPDAVLAWYAIGLTALIAPKFVRSLLGR